MKQALVLLLFATVLTACIKIEDPTIFEGKVVYEDDGSPAVGVKLEIYSVRKRGFLSIGSSPYGERKNKILDANGAFSFKFPYEKKLTHFEFNIMEIWMTDSISQMPRAHYYHQFNKANCSPYACDGFPAYKKHENLVIKIPRP